MAFDPAGSNQQVLHAEVFKQLNVLVELRRGRLNAGNRGLPMPIWALVVIGGMLCITTTWFFQHRELRHAPVNDRADLRPARTARLHGRHP